MTSTVSPRRTDVLSALRGTPLSYVVVALAGSAVLYVLTRGTELRVGSAFDPQGQLAIVQLIALAVAAAPVAALRWPVPAALVAAAPLLATPYTGLRWPFTAFVALLVVAVVSTWRSRAVAGAVAVASLLPVAVVLAGQTTMVVPFGYDIRFPVERLGPTVTERAVILAMYAAAALLAFGLGTWMRSSALLIGREHAMAARSSEIEGEAALVGERARLARDLHDVVAHHVSLIAVRAETAPYTYPELQPEARTVLAAIAVDARTALDELRGVLGVLRRAEAGAPSRSPQPTLADVATLVRAARTAGEQVTLEGDLTISVGSTQGYVAYRVVQEALTNARRHAPGQPVVVAVAGEGRQLLVRVTTPYREPSTDRSGARSGLVGMRERVEAVGGVLAAEIRDDVFVVEAKLPWSEA
jgi:signal transduction histidine kinase